ncbi:hypothetical protein DNTS_035617 [Danionella cerebrum]|uniref:Cadherin domain-containing protein n=1 Tax=Danionella cerebrum TaxID=2873325 RepID=A0A553Q8G6_9TELE|nr:hypothetical protein DNTS_035617 [Danionella translucida]
MRTQIQRRVVCWRALWLLCFSVVWSATDAQLRYTIPEELKEGSVVGNIAKDLGLDVSEISNRKLRIASESGKQYFSLNLRNGELLVSEVIDRETLCGQSASCVLPLQVIIEDPLQFYRVEVEIQDINDNSPVFLSDITVIEVPELTLTGARFRLTPAKDPDAGKNSLRNYALNKNENFIIHVKNDEDGTKVPEIVLEKAVDREKQSVHHLILTDINDNAPEITIASSPKPVREDAPAGTMVALIKLTDLDSGINGNVTLDSRLDRETFPRYEIELKATDSGSPPLESKKIITVEILDVNDNPPVFSERVYSVYMKENSSPGSILASVTASDLDTGENAKIVYSLLDSNTQGVPVSSYVYINAENGSIFSMHSFDYEKIKIFHVIVLAKDHGSPSLSSNATVHVFILDQNDNAPAVIYPSTSMGSVSHQRMPRAAKAGHLVTKVTAVDADSGHNAWLFYRLAEATDASLFSVNLHTGEVRTKRAVSEHDDPSQRLTIEIKDNGEPIQSTTVTVEILIEEGTQEAISDYNIKTTENNKKSGKITLYLIISLGTVSVFSVLTLFTLIAKCVRSSIRNSSCCIRRTDSGYKNPNRNLQIQLNTDGPIKYVEVLGGDMMSQSQSFGSYLSPMSEFSDLTLIKPSSTGNFTDTLNTLDASLPDSAWTFESQQVREQQ